MLGSHPLWDMKRHVKAWDMVGPIPSLGPLTLNIWRLEQVSRANSCILEQSDTGNVARSSQSSTGCGGLCSLWLEMAKTLAV